MSVSAFIPLIISSATGAIMANLTLNEGILLSFKRGLFFDYHNTPYYILLGVVAGFVSVYHARLFRKVEHGMSRYSDNVYRRAFVGAALLATLIFFCFLPYLAKVTKILKAWRIMRLGCCWTIPYLKNFETTSGLCWHLYV